MKAQPSQLIPRKPLENLELLFDTEELLEELTSESQLMKGAVEKGATSWLSVLPIKAIG